MHASEAIAILEALSPDYEVTLDIGVSFKRNKPTEPLPSAYMYLPNQHWQGQFWPSRKNEITCKMH